jgi:hypothetical protein
MFVSGLTRLGAAQTSLRAAYRRTGADMPWLDDPATAHNTGLEGWFWRIVDPDSGRVLVVLCGLSRPPGAEPWALVAVVAHPGGFVRWAQTDGGGGFGDRFGVAAPPLIDGDDRRLRARIDDDTWVDVELRAPVRVSRPSLGPAQALPGLHQYWHAHLAGATATGEASLGGERWRLDGAQAYAEKNWGGTFADDWWWGQGFLGPDAGVSFAGGRLRLGPAALAPTGVILRLGPSVHRLVAPLALVSSEMGDGTWSVRAERPGLRVDIEGETSGVAPHILPVPIAAQRRSDLRSEHHLAGRMAVSVRAGRRLRLDEETTLAGLERGRPLPPHAAPPG